MRRCSCFFLSFIVLLGGTAGAQSNSPTLVRQYATTLKGFGSRMGDVQAQRLAFRTVAQASSYQLDARLVVALVAVESNWNPAARSAAGAQGLGQLMPGTAAGLGVDPNDAEANIDGTVRYLSGLVTRYRGLPVQARFEHAIAAYNAGAGAVDHYGGIPPYPETQVYVRRVIGLWRRLAGM